MRDTTGFPRAGNASMSFQMHCVLDEATRNLRQAARYVISSLQYVVAIVALVSTTATADVVYLRSGKIIEGEIAIADGGGLRVSGPHGTLILDEALIERFELGKTLDQLVTERLATAGQDIEALYELGRWFTRHGMGDQARRAWQAIVAIDPDHLAARRALGQVQHAGSWVDHSELMRQAGMVKRQGRWILPVKQQSVAATIEQPPTDPAQRLEWAATRLPAASRDLSSNDADIRARAHVARDLIVTSILEILLREADPLHRERAAQLLGQNQEETAVTSLVRSSVADREPAVRRAAVSALDAIDAPRSALLYLKPLENPVEQVRLNAIEALGWMRQNEATDVLVKTLTAVYGGGPRVHIFVGQQQAYIKDYDVEVAEAATIADPEIGYVTSGTVLDVKVLRITEYLTMRETGLIAQALEKRTGQSFGNDPQRWIGWWASQQRKAGG